LSYGHQGLKEKADANRFQEILSLKKDKFKITAAFQSPSYRKHKEQSCDLSSNFSFAYLDFRIQISTPFRKVWSYCIGIY